MSNLLSAEDVAEMQGDEEGLKLRFFQAYLAELSVHDHGEYFVPLETAKELSVHMGDGTIYIAYHGHKVYEQRIT